MIIRHENQVTGIELMPGVTRKVLIGPHEGAPNFIMRIFELQPDSSTPFHAHPWEHEIYIIEGTGFVKDSTGEQIPIHTGHSLFVPANEKHCLINSGKSLRFLCLIPSGAE